MLKFVFVSLLTLFACTSHAEETWSWLRVEAGIPNAVVMRGHAVTLSQDKDKLVLRLSDDGKVVDDFIVKLRVAGSQTVADFEPPNTEKIQLRVSGIHRESSAGNGQLYEEFVLADTRNGNFLVISRFRLSKSK